ncbi:Crp/Fnr family transcriptional regulator [Micromonospora purpureochromogenes]|uniref:CRP-like cAMP-binding protein n=1 Tax=Micromonospora purpureochromogenes TaxID=47872 RepID=A0ABX2RKV8_9ACTN|nr:Crp/Fnr family transcriptional regulator [Micromonospora purpureochromogenes]NYF57150.1 CRP-like cAMP-binding protein [Micromonospora purpureochromogenes]
MSDSDPPRTTTPARWPRTSFLGRLHPADQDALLRLGARAEFADTRCLLRQGDRGRHLLLLTSGRARVEVDGARREPLGIALRSSGDLVGELSYLDDRPRSASVVAVGPVVARHIPAPAFDHFLRHHPVVNRPFALLLASRLRAADRRTVAASYDTATRVAGVLYELAVADGHLLVAHTTQRELARLVGASQVSVHRILRRFSRAGLVGTRHGSILIRDEAALWAIAVRAANCIT